MSWRATETLHQMCHLDRRQAGVIAPVDPSYSRPRIRLFVGIGGQHTEDDRHPVVKGHPRDPAADLGADVLKVGCLPSDYGAETDDGDRKSTRLNSSHVRISYAVFCLKKKTRSIETL